MIFACNIEFLPKPVRSASNLIPIRCQKTVFSVKPLFKRFKRFESVFSRGALRSEKTDL